MDSALQCSYDRLERFDLSLQQPRSGFRFSLDPLLLCEYACRGDEERVIDLGCGSGIIALVMARKLPACQVIGLDYARDAVAAAQANVILNGCQEQVRIQQGDVIEVKRYLDPNTADLVVMNPPYRRPNSGRLSPDPSRRQSCHESTAGLEHFLAAARYLVSPKGRIAMIYPSERLAELVLTAKGERLTVVALRPVYGREGKKAKLVLITLVKGSRGVALSFQEPLVVRDREGKYSAELQLILYGTQAGDW